MDNKKILFIIPARPDFVPYVNSYFNMAEECGRKYDVVCWNRRGEDDSVFPANYKVYHHPTNDRYSSFKKIREIFGFYRFVRHSIKGCHYSAVFTFTIADSIFFAPWLSYFYKDRFVFDIRDYSPFIDSFFSRWLVKLMLKNSAINVISSEGFRHWLPYGLEYTVCHNTDIELVRQSISNYERRPNDGIIRVLTIGTLRNAESNIRVIDSLGNREGVQLDFAGDGKTAKMTKNYYEKKKIKNVSFFGRYPKEEEDGIVKNCDVLNVVLPHDQVSDYLMSNRFYLSARMRKPMIVNDGCFQAEVVRQFGLGLIVYPEDDIYSKLKEYWINLNWSEYNDNCKRFLKVVLKDMSKWNILVREILTEIK